MTRLHVVRAEMRLSRPDTEPLRQVAMDPDPLQPFERVLARCDPARGESAEVILDLLPLTPDERMEFRTRQRKAQIDNFADVSGRRRPRTPFGAIVDALRKDTTQWDAGEAATVGVPRNEAARRLGKRESDQVAHRVVVPTALFYVQMLIRATSYDRKRAYAHLYALLACWELWAGRNWFELVLTNFRAGFIGSNVPPRQWWFDYRYGTGRFGPLRHRGARVVSLTDVAGWITPPITPPASPPPTPPTAPQQRPARPAADPTVQMPPARNADDTAVVAVDDRLDRDGQLLLFGMGRRGATVDRVAARVVARAVGADAGAVVLEADGMDRRTRAAMWGDHDRVELPLVTDDATRPVAGWNPVPPPAEGAPVDRAAAAVRALTVAARCEETGQAAALIDAAVRTLRALVAFLPRELTPTLLQITRLVDDAAWRESVLSMVDAPTRRFWFEVLPGLDHQVVRCVADLGRRLGEDAQAVALLGQPGTTYDPYPLLAAGRTVVLSAGHSPIDDVLATLLWFDASDAARARAGLGPDRAPALVGTAIHRYGRDREDLFVHDLAATVQSGAPVVLLTDRPDQLDPDMRRMIHGLATAVAVDTVDSGMADAAQWLRIGGESELRAALDAIDVDECLVGTARDGWRARPVDARRPAGADAARGARPPVPAGATLRETRARLDGLEDRIAEHLSAPPPPPPTSEDDPDSALTPNVIRLDRSRRREKPRE
jgi:hypothetical protein